jgi:DNA mismatch repair protein MutS
VAKLAGVPQDALRLAQRYFARLDKFHVRDDAQHDLFAEIGVGGVSEAPPTPLEARLRALDPDAMSPREALEALYALKRLLA